MTRRRREPATGGGWLRTIGSASLLAGMGRGFSQRRSGADGDTLLGRAAAFARLEAIGRCLVRSGARPPHR